MWTADDLMSTLLSAAAAAAVAAPEPQSDQSDHALLADPGSGSGHSDTTTAISWADINAVTDAVHTAGEPTAGPDTTGADTSDVYKTPPKPATGPTCIGFFNNCECPRCHNESRETAHGKPIPVTDGVTEMDSMGRKNLMKDSKRRKWGSQPPSPVL